MLILTKNQILEGTKYVEEFPVKELGGAVKIRALSDGELTKIEARHLRNLSAAGIPSGALGSLGVIDEDEKQEITLEQSVAIVESTKERIWSIVALAMSIDGQEWTVEEVSMLNEELTNAIAARAEVISGGRPGQAESFRANAGGGEVEKPYADGVSAE